MGILVTKIQSYSVHDGPGVRTTVFLKGCTLHCPWCANPETQLCTNELWFDEKLCIGKEDSCLLNTFCSLKKAEQLPDETNCPTDALKKVAVEYERKALEQKLLKDAPFWGKDGGITFSGGEPLLQIAQLEPLLASLKSKYINICFETALNVPTENVQTMLKYADRAYVDMKSLLRNDFEKLGGNLELYIKNIHTLDDSKVPYIVRIPLIKPYTFHPENIGKLTEMLSELHPEHVEIFAGHNMGAKKYAMLGRKNEPCDNVSDEELNCAAEQLKMSGKTIKILKLS